MAVIQQGDVYDTSSSAAEVGRVASEHKSLEEGLFDRAGKEYKLPANSVLFNKHIMTAVIHEGDVCDTSRRKRYFLFGKLKSNDLQSISENQIPNRNIYTNV
ncbi:hypothetical protein NQ317_005692 [Molorchus minor]|uniref:Uncharacterized protein n=1 Tax=Molorchus minor TaxID=1323400 RepID=A0ABQ9J7P4_9CUCU|nr:hypothetical protein NQ317_005692 [Molorchus minor]